MRKALTPLARPGATPARRMRPGVARVWPALLVAIVSSALTVLLMLPAAWIVPLAARATDDHLRLIDPSGSLWHGSATLMLAAGADAQAPTVLPGRIEWRTAAWPLLHGTLAIELRHPALAPQPLRLLAGLHDARLSAGSIALPAAWLSGMGAPFNTLALDGRMRVDWGELRLMRGRLYGPLSVRIDDLASSVSRQRPLGNYRLQILAGGGEVSLKLDTLSGVLNLSGEGLLAPGGVRFDGLARAAPEAHDTLAGLLTLLGPRIDDNTSRLHFAR